ncbi:MAG: endolytic transglycosylase MltG [Desulfarculaceae bacterium]|nr:endolytic transglycosylase MltG [Desulfarculaceae bacterium]
MQKKRILKRFFTIIGIALILLSVSGLIFILYLNSFSKEPANPDAREITFVIERGDTLSTVSRKLENRGVISSSELFSIFALMKNQAKNLKAGEYALSGAGTPERVLDIITKGKVKLYRLTVPEGLNLFEVAALAEKAGFGNREAFVMAAESTEFTRSLGISADTLEGYLFPETYYFPKSATEKDLIREMVGRFQEVYTEDWKTRTRQMRFTVHEIVTLASIIEKETGEATERPVISSVFHNRLEKGMRLESDPTVIYGIEDFDGNITRKDLTTRTPYNTYMIRGLPPGPIANPGKMSLKAALYPADTEYIFFVSKKDSTHKFSETIKEHNRAVRKYQLNR